MVERHTFENIIEVGEYTINHVNSEIVEQAHQTSARYPRNTSEFEATGLTPLYESGFNAPYVKEAFVQIGLRFKERVHLEINKTEMVIGEIISIRIREDLIMPDGFIDLVGAKTVGVTGLDSYHNLVTGERYSYAKADKSPHKLNIEGGKK